MSVDSRKIFDAKSGETKDKLAEATAGLIDGVFASAISQELKSQDYSGDPTSGSIKVNRFINAESKDYGTAREDGAGSKIRNAGKVVINVDNDREIIEELENKDIKLFGITDLVDRRKANIQSKVVAELDRKFFEVAESEAQEVVLTSYTTTEDKVDAMITTALSVKNDYVDGQDKEDLVITLSPKGYGKLRKYIDTIPRASVDSGEREIRLFHGVEVRESARQSVDIIVQRKGSIGMLVTINEYDLEKIPLSDAHALELFFSYGVKAVTPDLIFKGTL